MSRATRLFLAATVVLSVAACDLVDPMREMPHADTETFGNLIDVQSDPEHPGSWVAKIRVGVPRALGRADEARPTPDVVDGILAVVLVTPDTVVLRNDRPAALEDIDPGSELVAIPVPGTTTMIGEKEIHLEAAQLMDFATYARWRLPKLELPGGPPPVVEDPMLINSSGVEEGPVPVGDGRVLYFSARLRRPELPDGSWIGARRDGLATPAAGGLSLERTYRAECGADGWSAPELVVIPGTETARVVKLSWVSADERRCFVTVSEDDGEPWVGVSERASATDPWGEVVRMEETGAGDAFDAVAMTRSPDKIVFATTRNGSGDLFLYDPAIGLAQQLQAEINTGGLEWAPRVGPANELYFVRGDRQLRFQGGKVEQVRLPGPHRTVLIEAAPTADGAWLFFESPTLRPGDLDLDIYVAAIEADGTLGPPVPVDDWCPEGAALTD